MLSKSNGKLFDIDNDFLNFLQLECINGLKIEIEKGHFDYLHGAFGILYALLSGEELKEKELNTVLDLILKASNDYHIFPTSYAPGDMKGINLHIAHGISAYIIVLAELYKQTNDEDVAILIERHCEILKNNFRKETFSSFSFSSESGEYSVRNAWCYGDLGISIALSRASEILKKEEYFEIAKYTWEKTCKRTSKKQIRIYDSPLCHGIFGNLLMYSKIYPYTNESQAMRNTISAYLEKIEWYHNRYGENFLKYQEPSGYEYHRTYLTGVSGIGLTCLELLNYDAFESSKLLLI
jgi:lantibiotic modifying enzyme